MNIDIHTDMNTHIDHGYMSTDINMDIPMMDTNMMDMNMAM